MLTLRTILHPTDFSPNADCAFRLACALARAYGSRLLVLHVGRHPVITQTEGGDPRGPQRYREDLTAQLLRLRAEHPTIAIETLLKFSRDPAGEIVQAARQCQADLIVLGTHGRACLGWPPLGGVAEQVLRNAPCPVVTVKTSAVAGQAGEPAAPARPVAEAFTRDARESLLC
jgi:nucleotide-binding universal stress UspA family protein